VRELYYSTAWPPRELFQPVSFSFLLRDFFEIEEGEEEKPRRDILPTVFTGKVAHESNPSPLLLLLLLPSIRKKKIPRDLIGSRPFFSFLFFSRSDRNRNRQIYDFSHYHRLVFFFFFFPSSTVSPHMATDGRNFEKKKIKIPKLFSSDRNICPGWCPLRSGAVTHVLRARAGYPCKKKKKIFSVDIQVAPPKNGTRTAIDLIPYAK
jgi:hypothetical protein